jgi:hypothetical protein
MTRLADPNAGRIERIGERLWRKNRSHLRRAYGDVSRDVQRHFKAGWMAAVAAVLTELKETMT